MALPELRIAVMVGSLRKDSINRKVAHAMRSLAPGDVSFTEPRIDDLPPYDQDDDAHPPPSAVRLKKEIAAASAVLFVTPEYNRSIPGVLKNAIDHASRPYGQSAWNGKPAGIIGASIGAAGSSMAQQHLRNVLAYLDMPTLGQPEVFLHVGEGFFGTDGGFARPDTQRFLQGWMDRYLGWVRKIAG